MHEITDMNSILSKPIFFIHLKGEKYVFGFGSHIFLLLSDSCFILCISKFRELLPGMFSS